MYLSATAEGERNAYASVVAAATVTPSPGANAQNITIDLGGDAEEGDRTRMMKISPSRNRAIKEMMQMMMTMMKRKALF